MLPYPVKSLFHRNDLDCPGTIGVGDPKEGDDPQDPIIMTDCTGVAISATRADNYFSNSGRAALTFVLWQHRPLYPFNGVLVAAMKRTGVFHP
jgi:hypothetical protein